MLQSYLLVQGHSEHDGHATTVPGLEWECACVYVTLFQADSTEEALGTLMLLWSLGCEVSGSLSTSLVCAVLTQGAFARHTVVYLALLCPFSNWSVSLPGGLEACHWL